MKKTSKDTFPVRRHPVCRRVACDECFEDHMLLQKYFEERLGRDKDWLGRYRRYLEDNDIPAEVEGWMSPQAFDRLNADAFVDYWRAKRGSLKDDKEVDNGE
jgi:hypothetical protein